MKYQISLDYTVTTPDEIDRIEEIHRNPWGAVLGYPSELIDVYVEDISEEETNVVQFPLFGTES